MNQRLPSLHEESLEIMRTVTLRNFISSVCSIISGLIVIFAAIFAIIVLVFRHLDFEGSEDNEEEEDGEDKKNKEDKKEEEEKDKKPKDGEEDD